MKHYLVDYENVNSYGLEGIDKLSEEDRVTIFYSEAADTIKVETVLALNRCSAAYKFVKISGTGHNYLDFQLVAELSMLVTTDNESAYYIISKDKGYEAAIEYLSKRGSNVRISRFDSIEGSMQQVTLVNLHNNNLRKINVFDLFQGVLDVKTIRKYGDKVRNAVRICQSKDEYYRTLVKEIGNEDGRKIYMRSKKRFEELKAKVA